MKFDPLPTSNGGFGSFDGNTSVFILYLYFCCTLELL